MCRPTVYSYVPKHVILAAVQCARGCSRLVGLCITGQCFSIAVVVPSALSVVSVVGLE